MSTPKFTVVGTPSKAAYDALAKYLLSLPPPKDVQRKPEKKTGRPLGNAVRRKLAKASA